MTISALLLITEKGQVLLNRFYRDDLPKHAVENFKTRIILAKKFDKPVVSIGEVSYLYYREGDIYVVAMTKFNVNAAMCFQFLYGLVDVFKQYFKGGKVNEESIRTNFVLVFELLDEVMDNGLPQITSVHSLKSLITLGEAKDIKSKKDTKESKRVTDDITGRVDWRSPGIVHEKNEVFIDVMEELNLLESNTKQTLRVDVSGSIMVRTFLSGMPECKLGLNDQMMMANESKMDTKTRKKGSGIAIDDMQFHRCVQLHEFTSNRTISFVPPDGEFELLKYRCTNNINLPFSITPNVTETATTVTYNVTIRGTFDAKKEGTKVTLSIPTPDNTARCAITSPDMGFLASVSRNEKAKFNPSKKAIFWQIKSFPGDGEYTLTAEVKRLQSMNAKPWVRPPITVTFHVGLFQASGLNVRFLRIYEASNYETIKWVRYMTKAGQYQIRI
jgi:AP-2 complex subunit mu-1